ncbi:ABC transporter permease [Opitutaceae bacterium TAV4]|nr:ABC transporter permease [Opitutaceae bacterium TAV4]RRK02260.1 ABC transporter permease [Opitutaceae bacterium TAV3]
MSTNLSIALRFLGARKRAMLMSLAGIIFGVAFFILTQAQTAGFEAYFIKTILGVNGMVRIEDRLQSTLRTIDADPDSSFTVTVEGSVKYIPGIQYPNRLLDALQRIPEVTGASPVIRGNATLKANFREYDCKPYGIDLTTFVGVSDIEGQIVDGSMQTFAENPYGLLLGARIAQRLNLHTGDSILLESAHTRMRFRISAIYETGIDQVDRERVYIHLTASRSLLARPDGASFIQVNLDDPARAPFLSQRIGHIISHYTMPWQEREKTWLQVFSVLRISSALTISTIILISGLGMFNTLVMIVIDKTREIAILRSMGYTRQDITRIFMMQGGIVLACGIALGWLAAAAGTYGLSRIPIRIRGIFASDHFVVSWDVWHYLWAGLIATVVVLVASYFPARRAARLEPGTVIRGSGD